MPIVACLGCLCDAEGEVDTAAGGAIGFLEFKGLVTADSDVSEVNSGVAAPGAVGSASWVKLAAWGFGVNVFPHWGQKLARTRIDTPQVGQRRAITGLGICGIVDGKW